MMVGFITVDKQLGVITFIDSDVKCFWGNVPASLMVAGTPQQVKDDVKELIDIFGDNGGLIIDSTMGLPDESKEENVQALTEAVHEYGVRL